MSLNIDLSKQEYPVFDTENEKKVFNLSKSKNIIFGRNGTGKSTLCKLIEEQFSNEYNVHIFSGFDGLVVDNKMNALFLGKETKEAKEGIERKVYDLIKKIPVKENGYVFDWNGFKQSEQLQVLLEKLNIPKTTFHGLRDTHASFLFAKEIDLVYVSKRLGHINIQTTQNYYLELMPEKKHQQDADALNLLSSL